MAKRRLKQGLGQKPGKILESEMRVLLPLRRTLADEDNIVATDRRPLCGERAV